MPAFFVLVKQFRLPFSLFSMLINKFSFAYTGATPLCEKKCAFAFFYAFSMSAWITKLCKNHLTYYNYQNQSGFKVTLVAFMGFFSDVHSLMCPQMVCKQNFHFSLNVTYLKSLVLSQIGIFISGTETMICHLKRKGLEVGVWDGNYLTISLTI